MEDCVDFLNWNICYGSSYNTRGYAGGGGGEKDAALLLNSIMMGKTFIRCLSISCKPHSRSAIKLILHTLTVLEESMGCM